MMIKNERQYRITKAQAEKFERALAALNKASVPHRDLHPLLQKAQRDAIQSQLRDLQSELKEYEGLQSGHGTTLEMESLDEIPRVLIQARIAAGLSQKELGERLGLKEQQIQRYEATDYASASLGRVLEVINALGIKMRDDVTLVTDMKVSLESLLKRLRTAGLDRDFVLSRLVPRSLRGYLEGIDGGEGEDNLVHQVASNIGRVFGWRNAEILSRTPLIPDPEVIGSTRFKAPARTNMLRLGTYTVYAHFIATTLLKATINVPRPPIPDKADEFRRMLEESSSPITFERALRCVWDLGVPVLPLSDSGGFHAACWREGGRNVIVLKHQNRSRARWLFDLLHELRHAAQEPERHQLAIVEVDEVATGRRMSSDEQEANQFAGDVALGGRAEELASMCVEEAQGKVERLKVAVPRVASRESVPVDLIANYMAFRLSMQGINWWGAATNLQVPGPDPWSVARDLVLERAQFGRLTEPHRNLLAQALSERG